jgi:hypothetical protein
MFEALAEICMRSSQLVYLYCSNGISDGNVLNVYLIIASVNVPAKLVHDGS